jgi:hypothetical protein
MFLGSICLFFAAGFKDPFLSDSKKWQSEGGNSEPYGGQFPRDTSVFSLTPIFHAGVSKIVE